MKKKEDLNSLAYFKEEMINSLSQMEEKTSNKISYFDSFLHNQLESFQSKLSDFQSLINVLSEKTTKLEMKTESLSNSMPQLKNVNENLITSDIKIANLEKDFEKMCNKYDKIFSENLKVQGVIGDYCKFKSIKDFINVTFNEVNTLKCFKDKTTFDIKGINENILGLKSKVESIKITNGNYINERLKLVEKDYEEKINQYLDKIMEIKVINAKYYQDIIANIEKINKEIELIQVLKIDLKKQYEDFISQMEKNNKNLYDDFDEIKNNFQKIKNQFKNIYEFIKDVRFKKNMNQEISKNEIHTVLNNIETTLNEKMINSDIKNILFEKKLNKNIIEGIPNLKLKEANNFLSSASNTTIIQSNNITLNSNNSIGKDKNKFPIINKNNDSKMNKSHSFSKIYDKDKSISPLKRNSVDNKKNLGKLTFKVSSVKKKKILKV